ncbi:MAG: NADPH-dependent glutamate synthase [Chloroflexi bacterium]|nr:NADPH-dependent glutamate synthase [Chloroflexota bacterium]
MTNLTHDRLMIPVQPVPKQSAEERLKNWNEAYLGFDLDAAMVEAARCIQCPAAPCQEACPVHNDIPGAFAFLEIGDIHSAADVFRQTSNLPEMCGRLCPQEKLCEGACVVGFALRVDGSYQPPVTIGKLEAFINDEQRRILGAWPSRPIAPPTGRKVAIIGSGPAGLAVAELLTEQGHACTVFEGWPEPGGVLVYGIPNFKMRKEIVDEYIAYLKSMGIEFRTDTWIGRDITLDDLLGREGYHAAFIGTGAGVGNELKVPGEDLGGVHAATDYLVRGNLPPEALPERLRAPLPPARNVVVIGGGDTSMDCVRTARRLGAETVTCMYRRTEAEMLGRAEERKNAKEEGVQFLWMTIPLRVVGENGQATGVECQRVELGEPDESGRRRPVPVPGSEFILPADTVVIAIGYNADPLVPTTTAGLKANRWALLEVDKETMRTSRPEVFAGGDNVNGADLVVTALADGRRAADAIHHFLTKELPSMERARRVMRSL